MLGAFQLVTYNDKVWGIPWENMPMAFTYDIVQFQNHGLAEFPNTWDELINAAKRLTRIGVLLPLMTAATALVAARLAYLLTMCHDRTSPVIIGVPKPRMNGSLTKG